MSPIISDIHNALHEESIQNNISGWIFTNFHNRDTFTDELLSLPHDMVSTRRWVYIILTDGSEIKIQHAIEPHSLDTLPSSETLTYSSQEELKAAVTSVAARYGNTYAILADRNISVISTVDAGFVSLLSECGIQTVTAAPLVQRTKGLLTDAQIESQERAGTILYETVYETWNMISGCYKTHTPINEYQVQQFILSLFEKHSLITDHAPIVAFGGNAGNPHYEPAEADCAYASEGDVIQLDIWAKEKNSDSVYADISWVGIFSHTVPERIQTCWNVLKDARDSVSTLIESSKSPDTITGAQLDAHVRHIISEAGFANALRHRTGHGIDTECHGSGVNLDSVEFPDTRKLLEGSSFSVEPGLYFEDFGLRTEIDVYIKNGRPVISGKKNLTCPLTIPQSDILTIF